MPGQSAALQARKFMGWPGRMKPSLPLASQRIPGLETKTNPCFHRIGSPRDAAVKQVAAVPPEEHFIVGRIEGIQRHNLLARGPSDKSPIAAAIVNAMTRRMMLRPVALSMLSK